MGSNGTDAMSDGDGNTFAGEGLAAPAAAPPAADLERARDDSSPALEHDDGPAPRDLDRPSYEPGDPRAKLGEPVEQQAEQPAPTEIEPPRSWNKELKEWFKGLSDHDKKAAIAERENERDREVRYAQNKAAEATQKWQTVEQAREQIKADLDRAAAFRAASEQTYNQTSEEVLARAIVAQAAQQFRAKYGVDDITGQQLQELSAKDPALAQQMVQDLQPIHQAFARAEELAERTKFEAEKAAAAQQQQARREQAERQQADARQRAQWAAQQDAEFTKHHPEFADEAKAATITEKMVMPLFREVGVPLARAAQLWNGSEKIDIRSVEAQRIMLYAAKGLAAERAAYNARPTAPPRPQSPGLAQAPRDSLASAANAGDMASYFKQRANGASR